MLKALIHRAGRAYMRRVIEREAAGHVPMNERPIEYAYVFTWLTRLAPQTILDVGAGTSSLPATMAGCGFAVTATDNVRDYWPEGMMNRHWPVLDDDIRQTRVLGSPFDVVTCISTLEHIAEHQAAMDGMFSHLRPGGHLILTIPYNDSCYIPNVYALPGSVCAGVPYIGQQYSRKELDGWIDGRALIVDQGYWRGFSGDAWSCGKPLLPPLSVRRQDYHDLTCLVLRKS
jgi:SAM-dependent methyltransferase